MLVIVMITEAVVIHVPQVLVERIILKGMVRLWDRGCTRDRKKSKKAL